MPSDEELRQWWEDQGQPPVTAEAKAEHMDGIVAWLQATTVEMWSEGKRAQYPLFDVEGRLVEQVYGDVTPIIKAGDVIGADLARRIAAAAMPPKPAPVAYAGDVADAEQEDIDPTTFVGIHFDGEQTWVHEPAGTPLLLTWIEGE